MASLTRPTDSFESKKHRVTYPTGDGKPMAETKQHRDLMIYTIPALQVRFAHRPDVYISGNDFIYYEEGVTASRVSPDCYVVFGVEKQKNRPSYKIWEENGIGPTVVFEFTSKKTRQEDQGRKRALYEGVLHVREYFQFDPTGDYLKPRLQGRRLQNGQYVEITLHNDRMYSEELGLDLVIVGKDLRFFDPVRAEWLLTMEEQVQKSAAETKRAETAAHRAETAAHRAEMEAHRAEMEAQRAETETQRAETETQRADEAAQRAKNEARRADAAEAELARLRAELEALRKQG